MRSLDLMKKFEPKVRGPVDILYDPADLNRHVHDRLENAVIT